MSYSEADTKAKLITPQLKKSGWTEFHITREHGFKYFFTDGRKLPGNKRGKRYSVDYLLSYKNVNLGIVEAKSEDKDPLDGLQQAIAYAEKLKVDFVYSTNGHKIYEHSLLTGNGQFIEEFPAPAELFARKFGQVAKHTEKIITYPLHLEGTMKPRFYQQIAVQKSVEAIANQQSRILLTLATGTGKTYIAFQIVYRLFQALWNRDGSSRRPRILFLADRNILADQAFNTFNPIEKDIIRLNGKEIRSRGGKVPTNANVFFAIYQAVAENKNRQKDIACEDEDADITAYYKQYPANFFDLIIIDECHRGSANDQSSWRDILNYFGSAVHLGLTATPKRDDNGDTYEYFGLPIYEYSLKDGINDGFLTPYKVKKVQTNIDEYHFNPDDIIQGDLPSQIVKLEQFEREVIIPKRTELIAKTILKNISPMDKTIIFCVNQQHALDMRIAIDKFKTVKDNNYCVRITSDEGEIGKDLLELFQDNDRDIPVILTSSKMLTTGVDARNVRNIVLTAPIRSMTEFKQIIGRGTRVFEGKDFFTIIDFVGATKLFYDDRWDGEPVDITTTITVAPVEIDEPVEVNQPDDNPLINTPDNPADINIDNGGSVEEPTIHEPKPKVTIEIKNKKLRVINIETSYVGEDGRPLSTKDYLELLMDILGEFYQDGDGLREIWSNPLNRKNLLEQLRNRNIDETQLNDLKQVFDAENSDIYDLLAHLSFNLEIKTRQQRAENAEQSEFVMNHANPTAQRLIRFILNRYESDGFTELADDKLSTLVNLSGLGTVRDVAVNFGGIPQLQKEYFELQREIYR